MGGGGGGGGERGDIPPLPKFPPLDIRPELINFVLHKIKQYKNLNTVLIKAQYVYCAPLPPDPIATRASSNHGSKRILCAQSKLKRRCSEL